MNLKEFGCPGGSAHPHAHLRSAIGLITLCTWLGGTVVTCSPLTAMAWVRLYGMHVGCLSPFTANAWWFSPWGFLPPSEGLKIVPFGTVS